MKKYEVMMMNTFVFESESSYTDWEVANHVQSIIIKAIREAVNKRNDRIAEENADAPERITKLRHQYQDAWCSRVVYPSDTYERIGLMSRLNLSALRPSVFRENWNNYMRYMKEDEVNTKFKRFKHLFTDDDKFVDRAFPRVTYKVASEVFSDIAENVVSKMTKEVEESFILAVLEHYDGMYEDGVENNNGE